MRLALALALVLAFALVLGFGLSRTRAFAFALAPRRKGKSRVLTTRLVQEARGSAQHARVSLVACGYGERVRRARGHSSRTRRSTRVRLEVASLSASDEFSRASQQGMRSRVCGVVSPQRTRGDCGLRVRARAYGCARERPD